MDCSVLAVSLPLPRKRRSAHAVVWNSILVPQMNVRSNFELSVKICCVGTRWLLMHLTTLCKWTLHIYLYLDPLLPFFLFLLCKRNSSVIQHQQNTAAKKDSCIHRSGLTGCFQCTVEWVSISEVLKDPFVWIPCHELQFHPLSVCY